MAGEFLLGCSGWNYADTADKGGWTGVFYPDSNTKRLRYYSQFFNTAEMDSTFYEKFYTNMTKGTFIGMAKATPETFQFSIKVPETITHKKRLNVKQGAMTDFEEFLDKISPLKNSNKLGAVLIQLPPSFTVNEGPWDMLKHYNIAAVMTDSPSQENLQFLSDVTITTASHSFIRFHGRNTTQGHYWYNYLYTKEELKPWVEKVEQVKKETKVLRVYFNNHYGGKALVNALQFKEMTCGTSLSENESRALEHAQAYLHRAQIKDS